MKNINRNVMIWTPFCLAMVMALMLFLAALPVKAANPVFDFPSDDSTVVGSVGFLNADEIGWFWTVTRGDSVSETFTSEPRIQGVVLDIEVPGNVLNSGAFVNWDLEINGTVVDNFTVDVGFTGPIHREVSFDVIEGPTYDVKLIVTNDVPGGHGSHSLGYAGSYVHTIELVPFTREALPPELLSGVTVGVEVFPVKKVTLLMPWLSLAGLIILGGTGLVVRRRRH